MAEPGKLAWASFMGGGVAAAAATIPLAALARQDVDESLFPLAAAVALVGLAVTWRRRMARAAFAGAALFTGFFALLFADLLVPAGVLLLGAAAWVVLRAPTAVRLAGAILFLWAAALVVATLATGSTVFAALSGLALAAGGLAYLVAWALRERRRWARHSAWAAALGWVMLCTGIALVDLVAFGDGLAVVTTLLLAGAGVAVLLAWPVHARLAARSGAA